jgi:hypothetical protein
MNKSNSVFLICPKCHHMNISDACFYNIQCSECKETFINKSGQLDVWQTEEMK